MLSRINPDSAANFLQEQHTHVHTFADRNIEEFGTATDSAYEYFRVDAGSDGHSDFADTDDDDGYINVNES